MAGLEKITDRYKFKKEVGRGAYGAVWSAKELETSRDVAIKRIGARNFEEQILTKRALRELKLLRHLNGNENIIQFVDANVNDTSSNFTEMYIVEVLMEADLNQIIKSGQTLTNQHYQYFTYQILRGLKWMHSANILHRDLKPGNLLVNGDCELRICDFGLARGVDDVDSHLVNTEYVATRYYRAPEVVLSPKHYKKPIDIWSVGCIFGELIIGRILFKGTDYVDQLSKIFDVLGTPQDPALMQLCSSRVLKYIKSWSKKNKMNLAQLFPKADPEAVDLIDKMLVFDPEHRITAEQALAHPFLAPYHYPDDEPNHPKLFDFTFESTKNIDDVKTEINDLKASQRKKTAYAGDNSAAAARKASISGYSIDHSTFTNVPRDAQELLPQGHPTSIEEEIQMNGLKLGA